MPNHIKINVPTTVTLHVRQPQFLPYSKTCRLRDMFDMPMQPRNHEIVNHERLNNLIQWVSTHAKHDVIELHLPVENLIMQRQKAKFLANPQYKTALYFICGKRCKAITGHPDGTMMWFIDNVIYRMLTYRSITMGFWSKKNPDCLLYFKEKGGIVYFLYQCEKINEEPLKSTIIDTIGMELLERDKPKSLVD